MIREMGMRARGLLLVCLFSLIAGSLLRGGTDAAGVVATAPAYIAYGLNFSPYTEGQDPNLGSYVSEAQLRQRMAIVAPYTKWIRTFGATHGLEAAGRIAREFGLRVAMGAWIGRSASDNDAEIANLIGAAKLGEVDIVIVGSETMLRRDISEKQLLEYISRVKQQAPGVPVTSADVYGELLARPAILAAVDVVLVNYYPYWEGYDVNVAMGATHWWHQLVTAAAGGKPVIVSEAGWPTGGNVIGNAVPSPENSAFFFLNFVSWARANDVPYFYFEAFDESWKAAYEGSQGKHWGVWDKDGNLKPGMERVFAGETIADNWSGNNVPGGPGAPALELAYVPPFGSFDDLEGRVWHVRPADYKVVVYTRAPWPPSGGWWIKPTTGAPLTPILADGSWRTDITTGGVDQQATELAAFLIRNGYAPPLLTGSAVLPEELHANAVAEIQIARSAVSISGQITDTFGLGVGGVTLALTGSGNATTQTVASGKYSFFNLTPSGNYVVTPSKRGFSFTPGNQQVTNLSGARTLDFLARAQNPPIAAGVSPSAGAASSQPFTFTFADPDGWQDLGVVNVLINFWLDGRYSCYLAYSRPLGVLYLVNDAGTALLPELYLGSAASVSNSQCTVYGTGSSATGSGNTLTLTLNIGFKPAYAGTKIIYLAARDLAENNSGWQRLGVWTVPGAASTSPAVAGMTPQRGSGAGPATFTFQFTDNDGWQDLGVVNILVNDWLDGRNACYLAYSRPLGVLYLVNDAGTALLPELYLGSAGSVSNSQCTVYGTGSSALGSGATLTLTLSMSFTSSFAGNRVVYLAARDVAEHKSGWQALGSWTAP